MNTNKDNKLIRALHKLTMMICVGFSTVCTYYGFVNEFELFAAIAVAAIVAIMLLAAAILITQAFMEGRSAAGPIGLLLFAAVFSFISNFNFLYTRQVLSEVNTHTMREANEVAKRNYASIQQALDQHDTYIALNKERVQLRNELDELEAQVTDRRDPGIGPRAQRHIDATEDILGAEFRVTDLARPEPGYPPAEYKEWAIEYRERVNNSYNNKLNATHKAFVDLEALLKRYRDAFVDATAVESNRDQSRLEALQQANVLLKSAADRALTGMDVALDVAPVDSGKLGTIGYALRNGFVERPYPSQTAIWSGASLLLDFLPAVFAWLAFGVRRNQNRGNRRGGTSGTPNFTHS